MTRRACTQFRLHRARLQSVGRLPERSSQPRWQRLRQECQPDEFSCDPRFRPFRMLSPNSLPGQFPRKHTHFKCHEQALFSRHCPLNLELHSLRGRRRIGDRHGQMLSRGLPPDFSLTPHPYESYPPAIAPIMMNGSFPAATASGNGASGGSCDRSSSQAKNLKNGRRCCVTWSRIVPRSIGKRASTASRTDRSVTGPSSSSCTSLPTCASVRRCCGSMTRITLASYCDCDEQRVYTVGISISVTNCSSGVVLGSVT